MLSVSVCQKKKKKCPNNKKEIYNDKYKHTRDRLFGQVCDQQEDERKQNLQFKIFFFTL
jgi:hypothetical protein